MYRCKLYYHHDYLYFFLLLLFLLVSLTSFFLTTQKDNENCNYWAGVGECTANPAYMLTFCKKSCGVCSTRPTTIGLPCQSDSDCWPPPAVCDSTTGICYGSSECKALRHSPGETFNEGKLILIFVGSDFTNLNTWKTELDTVISDMNDYPFFGPNTEYVSFYVNQLEPSFCQCGCHNVDRLLCCETAKSKEIASKCFDDQRQVQIVAVHNTETYCAAGGQIATVSISYWASIVVVHEIGHSLFSFQDEYVWDYEGNDR